MLLSEPIWLLKMLKGVNESHLLPDVRAYGTLVLVYLVSLKQCLELYIWFLGLFLWVTILLYKLPLAIFSTHMVELEFRSYCTSLPSESLIMQLVITESIQHLVYTKADGDGDDDHKNVS